MARTRRQPALNFDGEQLLIWQIAPFQELYTALAAVRQVSVPARPLGLVTGDAGTGKTFCANVYAHNNDNTVIVTTPPRELLTPRMLLEAVAEPLDIELPKHWSRGDAFGAVADALAERRPYVIVDEADRLRPGSADTLRELSEVSGAPLCYLGCPSVERILAYVPATHHRVGLRHHVRPCELTDLQKVLSSMDMGDGRVLDDATIHAIWETARGNLRHIESLLHLLKSSRSRQTGQLYEISPKTVKLLNTKLRAA